MYLITAHKKFPHYGLKGIISVFDNVSYIIM